MYANNDKILSVFRPTSDEEVLKILKTSGIKVSELDPVPAHLLVDSLDEIVPFFTVLINASLSTGCIDDWVSFPPKTISPECHFPRNMQFEGTFPRMPFSPKRELIDWVTRYVSIFATQSTVSFDS